MDTVWLPTVGQKKKKVALNIIDYASHFQMMIPLRGRSPEAAWSAYRQWVKFFGPAKQIWADQGSEFKGSFRVRTAQEGTRMDPSSLEAPTRGLAERHGKTYKIMLEKTMADYNCGTYSEWAELVDTTMMMKNRLASRGGVSPVQRVLGFLPRLPGGLHSGGQDDAEAGAQPRLGDAGIQRSMDMRKAAAKAFFEIDCDQALKNVLAGGPRPHYDYQVGQMVYFYRLGHSKKGDRPHQRWHGPARVVMTDYPSTIWLSYQGNLVKAAPERIPKKSPSPSPDGWMGSPVSRRSSRSSRGEATSTSATSPFPSPRRTRRTISPTSPTTRTPDQEDNEPVRRRMRGKTDPHRLLQGEEDQVPTVFPAPRNAADEDVNLEPMDLDERQLSADHLPAPIAEDDEDEAVEPPTKRTRVHLLETYYAKLETLFKTRQRKEVKLKDLNARDLQSFLLAAEKEVNNNLETQAYEKLDAETSAYIRRTKPDRIMESRFVRTAKPLEPSDIDKATMDGTILSEAHGGPCKAKVRHVMKGFSEDGAEELDSATPQVTREGVMFVTQLIASKRWKLGFLDFIQAFHSGDPIDRELYAEQPPEGIPGMGKGELLKLIKTCYGLLDGPMAWFRHLRRALLEELGYTQSLADPCIYFLHDFKKKGWDKLIGVVSVATDDLLHGGDDEHQRRMEVLNRKYKLGKFQYGSGRFTGKQFTPQPDGSIVTEHYVTEKVQRITLTKARKAQRYSHCTEDEISQMRSLIGALSWLAKETRPDLSGRVSLLQQQFPRPRVKDIISANQLASEAEKHDVGIKISPIPIERLRVSAVTDASWGNAADGEIHESSKDFWTKTPDHWVRHHVCPRKTLFHPGMTDSGPDLHAIKPNRRTLIRQDGQEREQDDPWNTPKLGMVPGEAWVGQSIFTKYQTGLRHQEISEGFLQNKRTQSQGGHLIIFHDQDLQFEPSARISITSWKSYRLKRKVVNTLSAECQALVNGIGNVHWHRFLLMEASGESCENSDWEGALTKVPYLAVTDSKSLFDALSKQTCPYSQIDDKRTAIDISIVKHELSKGGTVRWIDGRNMISDSLTKSTGGNYLRHVMMNGRWTLNELGFDKLSREAETSQEPERKPEESVESVDFIEASSEPFSLPEPLRGRLGTQESVGPLRGRVSMVDPGLIRQHIEAHETRNNRLVRAMSSLQSADLRTRARDAVQSGVFNAMILFLIVVNAILLGVEIQVSSHIGEDDIPSWFMVVNTGIVGIFVIEIILKLVALGCHEFWRGPQAGWNMFDVIIVAFSALEVVIDLFAQTLAASMWGADAWSFMRTLRLARALRGLRFFRMIRYFSALRALILSIVSTMSSLLWTLVLLFLLFYSFSVIIMQMVSDYCRYLAVIRSSDKNAVPECPESLRLHWPGVAESMLTLLFAITDGISWEQALNPLREVSLLAVAVLIFYIIISFFTILNVVTGVFVNTAIERASYDRDIASLK
ncbi:Scn11a, partial [Symbiodinium sp. CCMP2456]